MGKNYGAYNFESKQIETLLLAKLSILKWIYTGALVLRRFMHIWVILTQKAWFVFSK